LERRGAGQHRTRRPVVGASGRGCIVPSASVGSTEPHRESEPEAMDRTADRRMIVGGDLDLAGRVAESMAGPVERFASAIWPTGPKRQFEGLSQLVVLGAPTTGGTPALDGTRRVIDVDVMRAVLDAASSAGVGHLVVLSTAMVYGAWGNNAVPLTEAAPLRPV